MWLENDKQEESGLSLDEIEKILHHISTASGVMGVTFTGGEPLLRSDLHKIVRMCRQSGMKAALATNGTLLTEKAVYSLMESGIEHFDIGFTDPTTKTRLALAAAAKSGCTVTASICIHKNNYERTGILCELASVLGADAVALNRFVPTGRGKRHSQDLRLSNEDLLTALKHADRAAVAAGIYIYTGIPVEPCIASSTEFPDIVFSTCQCGESKWAIDPSGNLRTCEQNREILGNLLEKTFTEITESKTDKIHLFRQWRPSKTCNPCTLPGNCRGGCRFLFIPEADKNR